MQAACRYTGRCFASSFGDHRHARGEHVRDFCVSVPHNSERERFDFAKKSLLADATMEFGLSNIIFGQRPPVEDDFRCLQEAGIRQTEIRMAGDCLDPCDDAMIGRVTRWAEAYGVTIHSIHGPSGLPTIGDWLADPDESIRRKNVAYRRLVLERGAQLGASYVVVEYECYGWWPYWPHDSLREHVYPQSKSLWTESIESLLDDARRTGVRLGIENIDGLPITNLAEMVSSWDAALVGVIFDTSHASYSQDLSGQLSRVLPRLIGTHLSDNDFLPGNQWQDRHWPPFQGAVDWKSVVSLLSQSAVGDCLIVEVHTPQDTIDAVLLESLERLRHLIDHLPMASE